MGKRKPPERPNAETVEDVWRRDQGRCVMCGRGLVREQRGAPWGWSLHHRAPRQMGGSTLWWINLPANLVLLCGSGTTGCHGFVESHREHGEERGFLVRRGVMLPHHIPIAHHIYGVVYLNNRGTVSSVPPED